MGKEEKRAMRKDLVRKQLVCIETGYSRLEDDVYDTGISIVMVKLLDRRKQALTFESARLATRDLLGSSIRTAQLKVLHPEG